MPEGRFRAYRGAILAGVVVNAVVALSLAAGMYLARTTWSAHYRPGFPLDMLMVKNGSGRVASDVELVLDGRWIYRPGDLSPGAHGFPLRQVFEDAESERFPTGYVPRRLHIAYQGGSEDLAVEALGSGP